MAKKNNKKNKNILLIIILVVVGFVIVNGGDFSFLGTVSPGAYVDRNIDIAGNVAHISYTIVGGSDRSGGIIKEIIPPGTIVGNCIAEPDCRMVDTNTLEMMFHDDPVEGVYNPTFELTFSDNTRTLQGIYYFGESEKTDTIGGDYELFECVEDWDCIGEQVCLDGECKGLCDDITLAGWMDCQQIAGGLCSGDDLHGCPGGNLLTAWRDGVGTCTGDGDCLASEVCSLGECIHWDYFCYISGSFAESSLEECLWGCSDGTCQGQECVPDMKWCGTDSVDKNVLFQCTDGREPPSASICPNTYGYELTFQYCYPQSASYARCCNNMYEADENCLGGVSREELLKFGGIWVSGGFNSNEMLDVITAWASGSSS